MEIEENSKEQEDEEEYNDYFDGKTFFSSL